MIKKSQLPVYRQPVHAIISSLESQKITSLALVECFLGRIQQYNPTLKAYVQTYGEQALEQAVAADRTRRASKGVKKPLLGIPIAIKDNIDILGQITTGGSQVWEGRRSTVTATLVDKLLKAGAIVLGKTQMVEFAMGGVGVNGFLGTPINPWDLQDQRASGGSSSGAGVSVAAGLAPWAIGTDTGGSIRIPSAWCGLTGLKTTVGRVSVHGILPLSHTLDTPGPMCLCVEDAALLYQQIMKTHDDSFVSNLESTFVEHDPFKHLYDGVEGLKLGRLPDSELVQVDAEIVDAYEASLFAFEQLGAQICSVSLPYSFAAISDKVGQIISAEGYTHVGHLTDNLALPISAPIRSRISAGRGLSPCDHQALLSEKQDITKMFDQSLSGVDALLTPTTTYIAPKIVDIDFNKSAATFTRSVNMIGRCALSLPNGFAKNGLPISLQIICAPYEEAQALRIGRAFEQATQWHQYAPVEFD